MSLCGLSIVARPGNESFYEPRGLILSSEKRRQAAALHKNPLVVAPVARLGRISRPDATRSHSWLSSSRRSPIGAAVQRTFPTRTKRRHTGPGLLAAVCVYSSLCLWFSYGGVEEDF